MATTAQVVLRRRRRKERLAQQRRRRSFWTIFFTLLFLIGVVLPAGAVFGGTALMYASAAAAIPDPQTSPFAVPTDTVTRLFDASGDHLLYSLQDPLGADRVWIDIDTLPPFVITATLIAEDPDFLSATRFDPLGMALRLWHNALLVTAPPDTSITGRLVRNVIAPPPPRGSAAENDARAREILLVEEINRRYSPRDVLEWHLNTNYYGSEAYGIEAAAQIYLGKRSVDLTLAEAALLAAIPTAPHHNPFDDRTGALGRQQDLLRAIYNAGLISEAQFVDAAAQPIDLRRPGAFIQQLAPDFTLFARRQAEAILNAQGLEGRQLVERGGLTITTTLDLDLYLQSECALRAHLARLAGSTVPLSALDGSPCAASAALPAAPGLLATPPDRGLLIVLDARTGEIRSMVGPVGAAEYQPGPVLQPFVYLDAFVRGSRPYSPATMLLDIPQTFPGAEEGLVYTVSNPDGIYRGPVSLRNAFGAGLVPAAAEVAYRQGMSSVLRTAHQIGLNTLDETIYDLMLLERGGAVSLLDIAYAYSVFATLGDMRGVGVEPVGHGFRARDPVAIRRIEAADGQLLWEYDFARAASCETLDVCTPLLEEGLAYLINDILADQETRWPLLGQDNPLNLARPAAVVNGTAGPAIDNWTVGYTPHYVTGVLLTRDDRAAMTLSPFAIEGAAPVWRAVMDYAHLRDDLPPTIWTRPSTVVEVLVCEISGMQPNGICPTVLEVFRDGMQPRQPDTHWQRVEINSRTGQLATVNTPPELRTQVRFFVPPEEALDWWIANDQPLPPTEIDTVSLPQILTTVRITQPQAFSYVGGVVQVRGSIDTSNMESFQLSYGPGLNPSGWISIGGLQTVLAPGGLIAEWDTTGLDGLYSLSLEVTRRDNTLETNVIQVTVDNIPPTVTLVSVEPEKVYRWPVDEFVQLEAQAQDNIAIDRVEFFHNGRLLGADENWPYQLNWRITGPGEQTFEAVVYDQVGNSARDMLTVEILRAGG